MPDNTRQYTDAEVQAMIKAYEKQKQNLPPEWFLENKLNELIFAECLLSEYPMVCINQLLYTIDGMPVDIPTLRTHIMEKLTGYVSTDIPKRISRIIETLKIKCHASASGPQLDRIHMRNGTLFLNGTFTANTEFSINRIPVDYNPDAPLPETFLKYVHDLLEPVDIQTLQEYMGLCFLPTNKAQKMLMILGNGGEGKSRLGIILNMLFGSNMITRSVQWLETDRFARANLENKLLLYDDDMVMEALPATHNLKTLIILEGNTEVERKGKQSYQAPIYARFFAVGNGSLYALHDRSDGFFRRQLILYARPKEPDRIDDPFLTEKIGQEIEGIFLWCLEGLKRLIANDYKFTISDKAKQNLQELMEDSNNILSFMKSSGFIRLEANTLASSRQLYAAYTSWCEANCIKPISENPIPRIRIGIKFRQVVKKTGKTQTYNTDELEDIMDYLDRMYAETGNSVYMAIKINFFMGLRVGELVALKWTDICEDHRIHVVREEVRDQSTNTVEVADHTKTHTDRYVYLIPDALEILDILPRENEFIFTREGKRLTSRQVNYVLEKYAQRRGVQTKSSHKMRKTYASMCNANGVPVDFIREQLGHASLATTYGYIYNPLTEAESYKILTDALSRKPAVPAEPVAETIISLAAFRDKRSAVPKLSPSVPKFSRA